MRRAALRPHQPKLLKLQELVALLKLCRKTPHLLKADGEGFDTVCVTPLPINELRQSLIQGEAFSEAYGDETRQLDPDLLAIIDAWPTLSAETKASILTLLSG